MTVLRSIEELSPNWLTDALRTKGVLTQGRVTRVKVAETNHQASLNYVLNVKYNPDAPSTVPKSLFLKLSRPERLPLTEGEVEYYNKILAQMPFSVAPTCYSAEFDSDKGAYHILMQDVSKTHVGLSLGYPPTVEQALSMAKTLARFHAYWWEKPTLNTVSSLPTEEVIDRYTETCLDGLSPMLDFLGSRITEAERKQIETLAQAWPRWMLKRTQQQPNQLTLIHGDAHSANFLVPRAEGETYLVDRQPFDWSLTCWLGVSDLTYMMVHWWIPTYRERIEESVLRAYHAELLARGVENYDWEKLWQDYRLCAIQSLYTPLAWCALGSVEANAWNWYPKLIYTLNAIAHLKSDDLLRQFV